MVECESCYEPLTQENLTDEFNAICEACYLDTIKHPDIMSTKCVQDLSKLSFYELIRELIKPQCDELKAGLTRANTELTNGFNLLAEMKEEAQLHHMLFPQLHGAQKALELIELNLESQRDVVTRGLKTQELNCHLANETVDNDELKLYLLRLRQVKSYLACFNVSIPRLTLPLPGEDKRDSIKLFSVPSNIRVLSTTLNNTVIYYTLGDMSIKQLGRIYVKNGEVKTAPLLSAPDGYNIHNICTRGVWVSRHDSGNYRCRLLNAQGNTILEIYLVQPKGLPFLDYQEIDSNAYVMVSNNSHIRVYEVDRTSSDNIRLMWQPVRQQGVQFVERQIFADVVLVLTNTALIAYDLVTGVERFNTTFERRDLIGHAKRTSLNDGRVHTLNWMDGGTYCTYSIYNLVGKLETEQRYYYNQLVPILGYRPVLAFDLYELTVNPNTGATYIFGSSR